MRPGVSDLNVPLPLSYVPVQKTKGMPRRLQEEFQNGTEKTEMMLGGLNVWQVCPMLISKAGVARFGTLKLTTVH